MASYDAAAATNGTATISFPDVGDASWKGNIRRIKAEDFERVLATLKEPIVVEFMSSKCGHCIASEPHVEQLANQLNGKRKVLQVDLAISDQTAAGNTARKYQIFSTPTFMKFNKGQTQGVKMLTEDTLMLAAFGVQLPPSVRGQVVAQGTITSVDQIKKGLGL